MDVEGEDAVAGKKSQKKLNKKLKAESGEAVPSEKAHANGEAKKSKEEKKKEKKEKKEEKKEKKEGSAKPEGEKKEPGMKELPSGLQVKDVKVGSGKAVKKGDVVSMRYIGKFLNGKVFDSNTKGKPVGAV